MNKAKARDFFSDYYEGTMDAGLRQVFERTMASDAGLREDYNAFCKLMENLGELSREEVPEPAFLSERIASRIEAKLGQESAPARSVGWMGWAKWAFAGAAALAFLSVLVAANSRPGQFMSSFVPSLDRRTEAPGSVVVNEGSVRIQALQKDFVLVTVRRAKTGEVIERLRLDPWQNLDMPLTNDGAKAEIISVEFSGGLPSLRLALPGSDRSAGAKGTGSMDDLALAFADKYGVPVQVESSNPSLPVSWEFKGDGPVGAAISSAQGQQLTVEERKGPLLFIN